MEKIVYPSFNDIGNKKLKWEELVLSILGNCGPGILLYLTGFYLILHIVQNIFAELLRFGDRLFYGDWWTSTGFLNFFRSWNIIVSDWLYTYIYIDVYELIFPSKPLAKLSVFVISAIVHEWILYSVLGFFFPALFVQMIFCGSLAMISPPKTKALNVIMW